MALSLVMLRPYDQALVWWPLHVPHVPDVPLAATQVVKLLLRYGGNPQQSNRKGETPLKVASSPTMVNLLLGKGTYTSSEESSAGQCCGGQQGNRGGGGQDRWYHCRQPAWMPGTDGSFWTVRAPHPG